MAKSGRQVRPSTGSNEPVYGSQNRRNSPYRFVRPMTRRSGLCNIKCYDHFGTLLWTGDHEGGTVHGLAVDSSGNCYTSLEAGGYDANAADKNIIEKRDTNGVVVAAVAGEVTAHTPPPIGSFDSTSIVDIGAGTSAIYAIRGTSNSNSSSYDTQRAVKFDTDLNLLALMPLSNANGIWLTEQWNWLRIDVRGTTLAAVSANGTGGHLVYAWLNDVLHAVSGSAGPRDDCTGLEIGSLGELYFSSGTGTSQTFTEWETVSGGTLITQVKTIYPTASWPINGIAVSGASIFGLYTLGQSITGVTNKRTSLDNNAPIGANDAGRWADVSRAAAASGFSPEYIPEVQLHETDDSIIWSDPWGSSWDDGPSKIVVTSDRVYVIGDRITLQ